MSYPPSSIIPIEAGELEGGDTEKPTALQRERVLFSTANILSSIKDNFQCVDTLPVSLFSEGFEHEVPFAWFNIVRDKCRLLVLVARARWITWSTNVDIYCDFQGHRIASLEAHIDKAPMILSGNENHGPYPRIFDQRSPPGSANVRQYHKLVRAVWSAR